MLHWSDIFGVDRLTGLQRQEYTLTRKMCSAFSECTLIRLSAVC